MSPPAGHPAFALFRRRREADVASFDAAETVSVPQITPAATHSELDRHRWRGLRFMIMADAACPNAADRLPTPAERPGSDVVVYDGHCGICRSQISKLPWWDCQKKLSYLSLHDPEVARRWPDLSHDRMMQEMVIVDHNGNRYWGAEAIRYLSRRLRRLWWASPFLHFPASMLLWRPAYRWVARNRYRLSGGQKCDEGTCSLHR